MTDIYKKQLKFRLDEVNRSISGYTSKIEELLLKIESAEKRLSDIRNTREHILSITDSPDSTVTNILDKAAADIAKERESAIAYKDNVKSSLEDAYERLKILQSVCPHETHKLSHRDYYKDETYYTCDLCNLTY